jgi:DNA-binding NarL/FixJ family response regulator
MLSDLLKRAIDESPDMEMVATLAHGEDPRPTMLRVNADVVVVGGTGDTDGDDAQAIGALCRASPRIRVVRLSPSGRSATIHGLSDAAVTLNDVSIGELLDTLRAVAPMNRR